MESFVIIFFKKSSDSLHETFEVRISLVCELNEGLITKQLINIPKESFINDGLTLIFFLDSIYVVK
jgi:hypothetical protein